jgi:PAS domain-containing protein
MAGLITVFVIDPLDPTTVSTPFCLGIILMGLSLRQGTSLVVAVSVLYSILTLYALINFHRQVDTRLGISADPHPNFWLFQRTGLFFVLCALSCYLAYYRTDTERILSRLRTILGKLPTPVILSDASGHIVYANDAVTPVLQETPAQIIGNRYFDYLMTEKMKGKSIRSYFELFEGDTNGIYQLEIVPFGLANKMHAQIICLGTGQSRIMITVLQNTEKNAHNPASNETSPPADIRP